MPGYWLNGKSEMYWEIVGPDDRVALFMLRAEDDENLGAAKAVVKRLNKQLREDSAACKREAEAAYREHQD